MRSYIIVLLLILSYSTGFTEQPETDNSLDFGSYYDEPTEYQSKYRPVFFAPFETGWYIGPIFQYELDKFSLKYGILF